MSGPGTPESPGNRSGGHRDGSNGPSRPYAAAARDLCTENHDEVWFCSMCRLLERRLTPIHEIPAFRELLADADLTITVTREVVSGA